MTITLGKSHYTIPAGRSLVVGDEILYWEHSGSGSTRVTGKIVEDYYTYEFGIHLFRILLRECSGSSAVEILEEAKQKGGILKRRAKELYSRPVLRVEWEDENKRRQLELEKNIRSMSRAE